MRMSRPTIRRIRPPLEAHALGDIDGRHREARAVRGVIAELTRHVGGRPSAVQRLLIDRAAKLYLRLALMDAKTEPGGGMTEKNAREYLCWSNAFTRTLGQLGMAAAPSQGSPGLHQVALRHGPTRSGRTAAWPRQERRNGVTALVSLTDTLEHPSLFGDLFGGDSWTTWRSVLKGAFAEPMTAEERVAFRSVTDRDPPGQRCASCGSSRAEEEERTQRLQLVAVHAAAFTDFTDVLRPGEKATMLCLANGKDQARIVLGYIRGLFNNNDDLRAMITRETADGLELNNGSEIIVASNDFRSVRGRTLSCVIFDEAAFWRSEYSASPDYEVYNAVVPAQATVPGAILIGISSPYKRSGLLFGKWRKHYGKDGDVLVVRAPSRTLNPTLAQSIVDAAMEADPEAAAAEWMAEFRSDLSDFVSRAVVDACIDPGCHERPPRRSMGNKYVAFIDASGGSGGDSMTLGVAHTESSIPTLDVIRERRPPFSPDDVVAEYTRLMKDYGITRAESDHWGGDWVAGSFRKFGVTVVPSAKPKSDLYREVLPMLNAHRCALLDNSRLVSQLCSLERRVGRSGKDFIDHAPGGHDDLANACAGALLLVNSRPPMRISQHALERSRQMVPRHVF